RARIGSLGQHRRRRQVRDARSFGAACVRSGAVDGLARGAAVAALLVDAAFALRRAVVGLLRGAPGAGAEAAAALSVDRVAAVVAAVERVARGAPAACAESAAARVVDAAAAGLVAVSRFLRGAAGAG